MNRKLAATLAATLAALSLGTNAARAADLDPKAVTYILPDKVQWVDGPSGNNASAILYGHPAKPGPYAYLVKWKAGNMSRPHYHPNDRFITVLSGTWWVGSGPKFEPESTVPMTPGTWVVHYGKGIHYDGAKDGDTVIMIHGVGPATSTPAEQK